jgi:hypothetical protein
MVSLNLSHKHGDGDKALTTIEKNANIYEVIDNIDMGIMYKDRVDATQIP